jgi:hypothetical protein
LSALSVPLAVDAGKQAIAAFAVAFQQLSLASQAQSSAADPPPLLLEDPQAVISETVMTTKSEVRMRREYAR